MDTVIQYHTVIEAILTQYIEVTYANGDIQNEPIFDRAAGKYVIMSYGWQGVRRVHGCLIHINVHGDKVWIERDGTEHGIAQDLVAAGIPQHQIVLGFYAPTTRQHTEFAVS
jgi:XisI protein